MQSDNNSNFRRKISKPSDNVMFLVPIQLPDAGQAIFRSAGLQLDPLFIIILNKPPHQ